MLLPWTEHKYFPYLFDISSHKNSLTRPTTPNKFLYTPGTIIHGTSVFFSPPVPSSRLSPPIKKRLLNRRHYRSVTAFILENRSRNGMEYSPRIKARNDSKYDRRPAKQTCFSWLAYRAKRFHTERKYYCRALSIITVGSLTEWPLKWNWHLLNGIGGPAAAVAPSIDYNRNERIQTAGRTYRKIGIGRVYNNASVYMVFVDRLVRVPLLSPASNSTNSLNYCRAADISRSVTVAPFRCNDPSTIVPDFSKMSFWLIDTLPMIYKISRNYKEETNDYRLTVLKFLVQVLSHQ